MAEKEVKLMKGNEAIARADSLRCRRLLRIPYYPADRDYRDPSPP